jgi:hypothetical protein
MAGCGNFATKPNDPAAASTCSTPEPEPPAQPDHYDLRLFLTSLDESSCLLVEGYLPQITSGYLPSQAQTAVTMSSFGAFQRWLHLKHYQLELTFGVYMYTPWEKFAFCTSILNCFPYLCPLANHGASELQTLSSSSSRASAPSQPHCTSHTTSPSSSVAPGTISTESILTLRLRRGRQ